MKPDTFSTEAVPCQFFMNSKTLSIHEVYTRKGKTRPLCTCPIFRRKRTPRTCPHVQWIENFVKNHGVDSFEVELDRSPDKEEMERMKQEPAFFREWIIKHMNNFIVL